MLHTLLYTLACMFFVFTVYFTMSSVTNTFEIVKAVHKNTTTREKLNFYNSWVQNYDQVRAVNCQKDTTSY